ncbi:MAG TPA: type II secretion system protein [Vitreimonas sp.]|nr:type II secretion system protein [Vitreimonas sp.]
MLRHFSRLRDSLRTKLGSQGGFTMIELLVVIAVIGVLAVAVLSSINPIEQINKGRDTRTRSDAAQLINAVDRYYAIHEVYPWNSTNGAFVPNAASDEPDEAFAFDGGDDTAWGWVNVLESTGEVKSGFINRLIQDDQIKIFKDDTTNATMYACFVPTSLAFQQEAMDNCNDGTTPDEGEGTVDPCPVDDAAVLTDDNDEMICLP